jgi:hypothetical protein
VSHFAYYNEFDPYCAHRMNQSTLCRDPENCRACVELFDTPALAHSWYSARFPQEYTRSNSRAPAPLSATDWRTSPKAKSLPAPGLAVKHHMPETYS